MLHKVVMPAKAGIQNKSTYSLDTSLRWYDRTRFLQFNLTFFCIILLLLGLSCATKYVGGLPGAWAGKFHIVQESETVQSIAEQNHVSPFDLMEANGILTSGQVQVGQRLYIPESEMPLALVKSGSQGDFSPIEIDGKQVELAWPVENAVLFKTFNKNPDRLYEGIALAAPQGTTVSAAEKGEVIYIGEEDGRYGNLVIIKHEDPLVTIYAHLDRIHVKKGQRVARSQPVGTLGTSGGVDSPRVYFQVRNNRTPVDPELYLRR
ncbi:MAG: M23 family metallopeptidase [Deltaproteobacteria bacterium]|nr:M23 family metallopeptidase [Deltaproteobacteria bacterium]